MRHLYFCLFIFLLSFNNLHSQNPGSVSGHTLWLKESSSDKIVKLKIPLSEIDAVHFNFNPVIDLNKFKKSSFKNLLKNHFSLFVVFKSDTEDKLPVITLTRGKEVLFLNNKELLSSNDLIYKKVDSKKGIILSYLKGEGESTGRKNNSIDIEDFCLNDKLGKQQLLEVIYFPRILNTTERNKVETYLSIKYGLSIVGEADYINSGNDTIWAAKKNKLYNNRVTGVGRDDAFNLYQKQSRNADKDGLTIGLGKVDTTNAINKSKIDDKSFLMWGDNDAAKILKRENTESVIRTMKRIWKIQPALAGSHEGIYTQVRIDKKEMFPDDTITANKEEYTWLSINDNDGGKFDYSTAKNYRQTAEDSQYIYFDSIKWDSDRSGSDLFTLLKGPDFYFKHSNEVSGCGSATTAKVKIAITGGQAPYSITLHSKAVKHTINTVNKFYELDNIPAGEYDIVITDSNKKKQKNIVVIKQTQDNYPALASKWYLDTNNQVVIKPVSKNENTISKLSYQWFNDNKEAGNEKEFIAKEPGKYSLLLTNESGCTYNQEFEVHPNTKSTNSGWAVYPNPAKRMEKFTIEFNLDKESEVTVKINSFEGKLADERNLGTIKQYQYTHTIDVSAVYIITVTINGNPETTQLIVK